MQVHSPESSVRAPLATVALYLLGVAGIAFGITLLFLGMRAVMDIGGFCAEGGPYVIESTCPEGSAAATLIGIFAGIGGFFLAFWKGTAMGTRAVGILFLAWPALFGVLGFNFLQYGFDPPGDDPGWAWGWLVCGVVFWAMALGPFILGLRPGLWVDGAGGPAAGADARFRRATASGRRLAAPSLGTSPTTRPEDPSGTFPISLPPSLTEPSSSTGADLVDDLERLAALHRAGSLTDDEYARAKAELLDRGGT